VVDHKLERINTKYRRKKVDYQNKEINTRDVGRRSGVFGQFDNALKF
jgi:hypothetical protein